MLKIFHLFLIFLIALPAVASEVVLTGNATSYPGGRITVFSVDDYISGKRNILATAELKDDGSFSLRFELDKTQSAIVAINRVEAIVYVEPGKSYQFEFPAPQSTEAKRFDKTQVNVVFSSLPENDLNLLVRAVNADIADFVNVHYYDFALGEYRGADAYLKQMGERVKTSDLYKGVSARDTLKAKAIANFPQITGEFIATANAKYTQYFSNEFFRDYTEFSLAELELLSGVKRKDFYAAHFMSRSLPWQNPAFVSCFTLFYRNFLTGHNATLQSEINKAVNVERNPERLVMAFENDSAALSSHVRLVAAINGLKEIYNDKQYNRNAIEKTLQNITTDDAAVRKMAVNVLDQLRKTRENWQLEEFTVIDDASDKWQLSSAVGNYVYLMFFATWNSSSLKELQVMQNMYKVYGREILFVAVCMDDNYDSFRNYLAEHRDQQFKFVFGTSDPLLSEKCNVRSIPHAILLDQEGRTMFAHCRKPSEGIQVEFDKIRSLNKANTNGPKTWKDGK